ncbi:MlaD family protein [soil metagenome]
MKNKTIDNSKLGAFVLAGLLFLVFALYMIGKNRNLFGSTFVLKADFQSVSGLVAGNNVRFSGINVGSVNAIEVINDTTVRVSMIVDATVQTFIHPNSIAEIGTDGLMGNRLINIKPSAFPNGPVTDGMKIASFQQIETGEMMQTLSVTNRNIESITGHLKNITEKMDNDNSVLSLLSDSATNRELKGTIQELHLAGRNIARMTKSADEMVTSLVGGKGLVQGIFKDTVLMLKMNLSMTNVERASSELSEVTRSLKSTLYGPGTGQGPLVMLLNDSLAAGHLRSTLENLDVGSGKLSENMEAMRHNFLFRSYFKKKKKETTSK